MYISSLNPEKNCSFDINDVSPGCKYDKQLGILLRFQEKKKDMDMGQFENFKKYGNFFISSYDSQLSPGFLSKFLLTLTKTVELHHFLIQIRVRAII